MAGQGSGMRDKAEGDVDRILFPIRTLTTHGPWREKEIRPGRLYWRRPSTTRTDDDSKRGSSGSRLTSPPGTKRPIPVAPLDAHADDLAVHVLRVVGGDVPRAAAAMRHLGRCHISQHVSTGCLFLLLIGICGRRLQRQMGDETERGCGRCLLSWETTGDHGWAMYGVAELGEVARGKVRYEVRGTRQESRVI